MTRPIEIVLADDNNFFCEALNDSLKQNEEFNVQATFTTISELINYTKNNKFDVLILDVNFNGENSLNYVKTIREHKEDFKIIILTSMNFNFIKNEAIKLEIEEVVGKHSALKDFKNSILNVLNKSQKKEGKTKVRLDKDIILTNRKIAILQALYDNSEYTEKEISKKLFISQSSLKTHKRELFEITNTKNVTELMKFGIEKGIIILNRT